MFSGLLNMHSTYARIYHELEQLYYLFQPDYSLLPKPSMIRETLSNSHDLADLATLNFEDYRFLINTAPMRNTPQSTA